MVHPHRARARHGSGWLVGAAFVAAGTVQAAEWRFEPEITVGGTYTDNLELAPEGLEESDFVTELRPSFSLEGASARFQADIDYQFQYFYFAEDSDQDSSYHNLAATTTTSIVPERFFFDLNGGYGQSLVDPTDPIPVSNVLVSGNLTDYWTVDGNPYFLQPIGNRTSARLSYQYGIVRYPDFDISLGNNVDSVDRQRWDVTVGSNEDEPGIQWETGAYHVQADYEDFDRFQSDTVYAQLAVPFGPTFMLIGRGGVESDVEEDPRGGGLDEDFWEAGFRWEASARNRLEARAGQRFYGSTYFFEWNMDGARFDADVIYQEAPTTLSIEQLNPERVLVPTGNNPGFDVIGLTNDVYINKEGTAQLSWGMSRNELVLTFRDVRREYVETQEDERESGAALGWYWRLGARTQVNMGLYAGRITFRGTEVTDKLSQATLGVTRLLGERTMLDLSFRYDQRRSDTVQQSNEYTEQAVMLMFTRTFGRNQVEFGGRNNMPALRY